APTRGKLHASATSSGRPTIRTALAGIGDRRHLPGAIVERPAARIARHLLADRGDRRRARVPEPLEAGSTAEKEVTRLPAADEPREIAVRQDGLTAGEAAHRGDRLPADHIGRGLLLARDDQREALRRPVRLRIGESGLDVARAAEAAAGGAAAEAAGPAEPGHPTLWRPEVPARRRREAPRPAGEAAASAEEPSRRAGREP